MLTSEHDTKSISYFLKEYKYFVLKETGSWPFFNAVVVDWSWPSIHSLLYEWNNMTITQYLDLMYSCAVEEKSPPNITFILTCIVHVLHRVALAIDTNYSEYKPIKSFLLDLTSILFLCRDIWDLDMYYKDRLSLLLTKHGEKAEQSLLFLVGEIEKKEENIMQVRIDVQIIEEIVEELKIKREFKILHKKSKAIYTRSPFYDRYYR